MQAIGHPAPQMTDMCMLMAAMDGVFSLIARQHVQATDAECDQFDELCEYIGTAWRSFGMSVPHKLHLLESHAPKQFRLWRNLGDFGEDPIERQHNIDNILRRVFANIRGWKDHEKAKQTRRSLNGTAAIKTMHQAVRESTVRKNAPEKQEIKKRIKVEESAKKLKVVIDLINT